MNSKFLIVLFFLASIFLGAPSEANIKNFKVHLELDKDNYKTGDFINFKLSVINDNSKEIFLNSNWEIYETNSLNFSDTKGNKLTPHYKVFIEPDFYNGKGIIKLAARQSYTFLLKGKIINNELKMGNGKKGNFTFINFNRTAIILKNHGEYKVEGMILLSTSGKVDSKSFKIKSNPIEFNFLKN